MHSSKVALHLLLLACVVLPWLGWLLLPSLAPTAYAWLQSHRGLQPANWQTQALQWFLALLVYPWLEEFVFRQQLQSWLAQRLRCGLESTLFLRPAKGWQFALLANVISSVLFSLSHWPALGPEMALAVFVPSLALGSLFTGYRSLTLNFTIHSYWNLFYLLFSPG